MRGDSASLDKVETIKFDTYQNTVGLALTRILNKLNWVTLKMTTAAGDSGGGGGGGGVGGRGRRGREGGKEAAIKSVQSLISLLSWQLATLWDTVQRVSHACMLIMCVV